MPNLVGGYAGNAASASVIVSTVSLQIPVDTWTEIPLPNGVSSIFDFQLLENDIDITQTVQVRKTLNSYELLSLNSLSIVVITQGLK